MGKIFPVNCFLARDTVAFSPSHRFHIAVMVFSFGHEGVVLGAEFTAIRPFVIGRKNWLFSQTPKGASASAVIEG